MTSDQAAAFRDDFVSALGHIRQDKGRNHETSELRG